VKIIFEGLPGAGKSTVIRHISDKFNLPNIPEFVCFSEENWRKFGYIRPFYQVNDEAKEFLSGLFMPSPILIDRHYASTLAYSYALSAHFGTDPITGENFTMNYLWYRQSILDSRLSSPDLVFYLDISPKTSIKRQPRAGKLDYVWGNEDSLEIVRSYYHQFYAVDEPHVHLIQIDGEISLSKVLETAEHHITTLVDLNDTAIL